jgi:hypothetical protein
MIPIVPMCFILPPRVSVTSTAHQPVEVIPLRRIAAHCLFPVKALWITVSHFTAVDHVGNPDSSTARVKLTRGQVREIHAALVERRRPA